MADRDVNGEPPAPRSIETASRPPLHPGVDGDDGRWAVPRGDARTSPLMAAKKQNEEVR
jgi:hypothetical protein